MVDCDHKISRCTSKYEARYSRFIINAKNYVQQYNQVYLNRISQMKDHLRHRVISSWGSSSRILANIIDLESESDLNSDGTSSRECVLMGMVFKELKLRGSILDEFKDGVGLSNNLQPLTNLTSDRDTILLEDHSGRVVLSGVIKTKVSQLVTGVVIAVKGVVNEFGEFMVSDMLYSYELKPSAAPKAINETLPNADGKYIMFISGMLIGDTSSDSVHDLSIKLATEFVQGGMGDEFVSKLSSRITRIVIAGNSIAAPEATALKEKFGGKTKVTVSNSNKQLDTWLTQLLSSCHVNIMPGASDPANISLPQQPFHPCLFPHSSRFSSFERTSNPVEFSIDEVLVLGHAGQPVLDIARQTYDGAEAAAESQPSAAVATSMDVDDEEEAIIDIDPKPVRMNADMANGNRRLEILKSTIEWGHLCPTAPDTMPTYPFTDKDPFVLSQDNIPNIVFAGNQPSYASELVYLNDSIAAERQVRVLCVPSFRATGTIVLCDISDPAFPCYQVRFK